MISRLQMSAISLLVVVLLGLTYWLLCLQTPKEKEIDPKQQHQEFLTYHMDPEIIAEKESKTFVEEMFEDDMSESAVQNAIHYMSHQKVAAAKKWGFILLSQERVARLIKVVELNIDDYKHSELYLEILNSWSNNDFSKIDKQHNNIWRLQDGTIGRATGILSPAEEAEYIQNHIREDFGR